MAAGPGGSIDGPGGVHRKEWESSEERVVIPLAPQPFPTNPKSLTGRVSWRVPGRDGIVVGKTFYTFPVDASTYFDTKGRWNLKDFFRMAPPIPTTEDTTNFDFCSKSTALKDWVDASVVDGGGDRLTDEVIKYITEYFMEPISDEEERDLSLHLFKDLRPARVSEEEFQAVGAMVVAKNIQFVSFDDFMEQLTESVDAYIEFLKIQIDNGECNNLVFVFPEESELKSNMWVARLAYPRFKEQGLAPTEFLTFSEFRKKQDTHPETKAVTFDDCSYSGTQLSNHLLDNAHGLSVDVIVPFCTDQAREKIENALSDTAFFAPFTNVPTLKDLGLRKLDLICAAGDPFFSDSPEGATDSASQIPSRTLLFFEHKAADELSTLGGIVEGLAFPFHINKHPTGITPFLYDPETVECYKQFIGVAPIDE